MKKPMLACPVKDINQLNYPLMVSPKIDGVRAVIIDGVVMSRTMKPIPNQVVQNLFGCHEFNGFDGELVVGVPNDSRVFERTSSGVMTIKGTPDVRFYVFDDYLIEGGFKSRYTSVTTRTWKLGPRKIERIPHHAVNNISELNSLENEYVSRGYEGLMIRHEDGPYKQGRSTFKEGWLMKLKRFEDSEAVVLSAEELMHNSNEAVINELGQKERSSKKAGMVGKGTLGSLNVIDLKTGVTFDIGTGFSSSLRNLLWSKYQADVKSGIGPVWNLREHSAMVPGQLLGQLVKYKYQAVGVKDKPRFPVYCGFRDQIDL